MPTSPESPDLERRRVLDALAAERFDVLVIGGGITGAGVARDAAMRGLRVALVEQDDFASGTSSRSSRLVHGGVRYLEHGQLHLVFESSRERRTLLRIAPHLVRPLAFVWPVYRGARVARWKLAVGLTLYDALALFRNVGRHERLDARRVLAHEPQLSAAGLLGGARYWDAATDDARLTLANVLSARDAGSVIVNHARVDSLLRDGDTVAGARVIDAERGDAFDVRARIVVSAAGPWSDRLDPPARDVSHVHASKGVHVCVPRSRVGNVAAVTLIAPQDGRVMFVLPAGAFTIIGTTDTFDDGPPEDVHANEHDIAYLLESANHHFPAAQLTRADVVSAWAGLRPLAEGKGAGSDPGSISREHAISTSTAGLVRVTGGKLTTYRAMAEEIVDVVESRLDRRKTACRTASVALHGGAFASVTRAIAEATSATNDPVVAEHFVRAFGSGWRAVWSLVEEDASLGARISPERPYLVAELLHAVRHEMGRTLGDLLIRRVPVAFETADHGRSAARGVARSVGRWLGWDDAAVERALTDYDADVARMFGGADRPDDEVRPRLP